MANSFGLRRTVCVAALAAIAALPAACDLDLTNPNSPTEEAVLSDRNGIIAVAVGMQGQFAQTMDDYLVTNSLITDEWGTQSLALISYVSLLTGENFDASFGVVLTPFANSYRTIKSSNTVLEGAASVGLGPAFQAGLTSVAKLFKAMSLGMLIQQYQSVPIQVSVEGSVPQPRAVVMDTVLALLESAQSDILNVSEADLTGFKARVIPTGFDLRNTVNAMLARYYLMANRYNDAIAAADRVPLGVLSAFSFPSPTRNPVENLAFQLRYVGGLRSFVNQAEANDRRPAYWLNTTGGTVPANPPDTVIFRLSKYATPNEPFPVYLPDEMRLIKAEAYARTARLIEALAMINAVRTQTTSAVDEPVAGLPAIVLATEAQMLAEIARQRRYELYEQGLRWEDTRRFGTALTTTPVMTFLPLPLSECDVNPVDPCA